MSGLKTPLPPTTPPRRRDWLVQTKHQRFQEGRMTYDHWKSTEPPDSREPDHTRHGIFVHHRCWKCHDGEQPCVQGHPNQCEYPHARND